MTIRAAIAAAPQLWALAALCGSLIAVQQFQPLAFRAAALRTMIDTEITLCALAAACVFALSFGQRRRLRDLLLVGALVEVVVIGLVSSGIPAAMSIRSPGFPAAATMLGGLLISATFAAAAYVPSEVQLPHPRRALGLTVAAGILGGALTALVGLLLLTGGTAGSAAPHGAAVASSHPFGFSCALATAGLLTLAGVRLSREGRGAPTSVGMLLGIGVVLFAAARLNYLALPAHGISWVTASNGLLLAGCAVLLAAALRQEAAIRGAIGQTAAAAERRRIARDLHDGLAQDLAFIAAHGDRIAREEGDDHPLAIAARRALAVSRGAIADLSASDAPSAQSALRQVADELEVRFGVQVEVGAHNAELSPAARENVTRIVREAIVNAAHGHARNIAVSLVRSRSQHVLRVLDDGVGIDAGAVNVRPGYGLRSMRERATSLGGGLTARPATGGGTELEVVFP
jgi:signal transduction histidine kinase